MVSVFIEGVPMNLRIAKAVCEDNRDRNASYIRFGLQIRIKASEKLVLNRASLERAIERALTDDEWASVAWNHTGRITKLERGEIIFEDSEESEMLDAYWDMRLSALKEGFLNNNDK
ncbi:MAG: hypothetical protein OCU20_05715 [Methanophagales archaeon]|nr:hypothetical protein [Methanophagales archaeon]